MSVLSDLDAHRRYVAWIVLTDNGRRAREDMSPLEQAEYDYWDLKPLASVPPSMGTEAQAEAKRLYEEACAEMDHG